MSFTNSGPSLRPVPPEAARLFEGLAVELEEGRGDPEGLFAAHPDLAGELRGLYRGWLAADALFRSMAGDESLVGAVRREIAGGVDEARAGALLARLAGNGFAERYHLGELLGRGGMGEVRSVTDRVLGRELAMKVIRPVEPGRRARLLLRFLEEAEVIGRLEHPGIVPIHELGLDAEGQVYFTMPLVRGHTLAEGLAAARAGREGWSVARVLEVLLRVAEALAYAHSRGVLHRDLKPANVMVGRFGEVYVMDWGLARSLGSMPERGGVAEELGDGPLTLAGEVLGTPAYMAPEQARGSSAELDERCDVYALGAILYEVVAGARPYGERSSAEALALLEREPPPELATLAPGVNEELASIVRRAMAREREARYPSVAELAADLRAHLEGRVVRAHRTGPWVEARKWLARNRRLAAALGLAVLALVGGLAASLFLMERAERERANVLRLSHGRTLADLTERAERLWPAHPALVPALLAWRTDAETLVRALEPDAATGEPGLRAPLAELAAREARWSNEDRWWHGELAKLVAGIEALTDPEHGLLGDGLAPEGFGIGRRLELARRVERECQAPAAQARWEQARAALAADPRFAGVELAPQTGLVPLGADPRSGLQEFAHVLSGEVPARDDAGELVLGPESALVLVLLPPGEFWMGSQSDDPADPNFAGYVLDVEMPVHRRTVTSFFLGKHELTEGQWLRCTGTNPSFFAGYPLAASLPVESLSWLHARAGIVRAGLRLPAEAEWEYACRAGTTGEHFWGDDPMAYVRFANIKDQSALQNRPGLPKLIVSQQESPTEQFAVRTTIRDHVPGMDGFLEIAPVGSLQPNTWGLHDVIGNVYEWCEDVYAPYAAAGTARTEPPSGDELRVFRGGAFNRTYVRSAERGSERSDFLYQNIGVRPARSLEP